MPGRGHKVASRQAQLGQRRRRQSRAPAAVATGPRPAAPDAPSVETGELTTQPAVAAAAPAPRSAPRSQAQYHPMVLDHIGPELRRIGTLGLTALGILIVLSIVVL